MITGSADFTIRQWDTLQAENIACLHGTTSAVKCIAVHPVCSDVLASGTTSPFPCPRFLYNFKYTAATLSAV